MFFSTGWFCPVTEGDVPEFDRTVHVARQRKGALPVADIDRHIEYFGDALARGHGALHDPSTAW